MPRADPARSTPSDLPTSGGLRASGRLVDLDVAATKLLQPRGVAVAQDDPVEVVRARLAVVDDVDPEDEGADAVDGRSPEDRRRPQVVRAGRGQQLDRVDVTW